MRRLFFFFFLIALSGPQGAWAGVSSDNEASFGFTDNANYSTEKSPDRFMRLLSKNTLKQDPYRFGFQLGYVNYLTQNLNDALSWRFSSGRKNRSFIGWEGQIFGYHYLQASPGTTEENFSHVGARIEAEKIWEFGGQAEVSLNPGAEVKLYQGGVTEAARRDQLLHIELLGGRQIQRNVWAEVWMDLGMVFSDVDLYNRNYLELGASGDFQVTTKVRMNGSLSYRGTTFPNRVAGVETTSSGRGRGTVSYTEEEVYSLLYIGADLFYDLSSSFKAGVGWNLETQGSRSGSSDYSANQVLMKGIFHF